MYPTAMKRGTFADIWKFMTSGNVKKTEAKEEEVLLREPHRIADKEVCRKVVV